ncbi:MAG: TIGR00725 family protein [Candidatus Altiarchaeales archaeon]|nr:TIGR00725 family protein [Candidatus Altiarchaeales archaeon]
MKIASVIGQDGVVDESVEKMAYDVGREIAQAGYVLVSGGRGGVMAHACRGAKDAGGLTLGVLPGADKKDANPCLDIALTTGFGYARNTLVVSSADLIVAVAGRYGTLSEIALALNYGKKVFIMRGSGGVCDNLGPALTREFGEENVVLGDMDALKKMF